MAAISSSLTEGPIAMGPKVKMAVYTFVGGATGWLAAGNAIDMSGEFTQIYAAYPCGVDTVADHGYKWGVVFPLATTITSSNVLFTGHFSKGAEGVMTVLADATDVSAVASVQIMVFGI